MVIGTRRTHVNSLCRKASRKVKALTRKSVRSNLRRAKREIRVAAREGYHGVDFTILCPNMLSKTKQTRMLSLCLSKQGFSVSRSYIKEDEITIWWRDCL